MCRRDARTTTPPSSPHLVTPSSRHPSLHRRPWRPEPFAGLEGAVQVVEHGCRLDALAFPFAQRFESQFQILPLLFEDVVKRLLFAPAGFGIGQPVAKRVGAAAGAFDQDELGGDGALEPFRQRGVGGLGVVVGPFVEDVEPGQLLRGVFERVSRVMLPREMNPGQSQSAADSVLDATCVSQVSCGQGVSAAFIDMAVSEKNTSTGVCV
jgi:hypothetical protein